MVGGRNYYGKSYFKLFSFLHMIDYNLQYNYIKGEILDYSTCASWFRRDMVNLMKSKYNVIDVTPITDRICSVLEYIFGLCDYSTHGWYGEPQTIQKYFWGFIKMGGLDEYDDYIFSFPILCNLHKKICNSWFLECDMFDLFDKTGGLDEKLHKNEADYIKMSVVFLCNFCQNLAEKGHF